VPEQESVARISRWLQEIGCPCTEFDAPSHHTNEGNEMAEDVGYANQGFDAGTRRQDGFPPGRSVGRRGKTFVGAPRNMRSGWERTIQRATEHSRWSLPKACVRMQMLLLDPAESPEPRRETGE
jgi:hypothetical protein